MGISVSCLLWVRSAHGTAAALFGLGLSRNLSFVAALAVGAIALVVAPALWILRDAAARRRCPQFTNDYLRRTPCTRTSL
jgi:hypothetical protein